MNRRSPISVKELGLGALQLIGLSFWVFVLLAAFAEAKTWDPRITDYTEQFGFLFDGR